MLCFFLKIFTINFGGEEEGDGQKSVQSLTSLRLCLCMWSTGALLQFCLIWSLNKEVNVCWDAFWIRVYHHSFHWRIPKSRINNLDSSLEGLYLYIFRNNIKKCWKGDPERIKALIMKNIAGIAIAVQSRPTSDCQWLTLRVYQFVIVNCATKSQNHYITPNVLVYVFVFFLSSCWLCNVSSSFRSVVRKVT